ASTRDVPASPYGRCREAFVRPVSSIRDLHHGSSGGMPFPARPQVWPSLDHLAVPGQRPLFRLRGSLSGTWVRTRRVKLLLLFAGERLRATAVHEAAAYRCDSYSWLILTHVRKLRRRADGIGSAARSFRRPLRTHWSTPTGLWSFLKFATFSRCGDVMGV